MGALNRLPKALQGRSSVVAMANQVDSKNRQIKNLRDEVASGPGIFAVAIPAIGGGFGAGWLDAKNPDFANGKTQPSVVAGAIALTASWFTGMPWLTYLGVGAIVPQGYVAGVRAAGYELAIVEPDPETPDETLSGDTA